MAGTQISHQGTLSFDSKWAVSGLTGIGRHEPEAALSVIFNGSVLLWPARSCAENAKMTP